MLEGEDRPSIQRHFHDSHVERLVVTGDRVVIEIEGSWVYDASGNELGRENGSLVIEKVSLLTEMDVPVAGPTFDYQGGHILELEFTEKRADLMLYWHNYSLRTDQFAMYVIEGEQVTWLPRELLPPEGDPPMDRA